MASAVLPRCAEAPILLLKTGEVGRAGGRDGCGCRGEVASCACNGDGGGGDGGGEEMVVQPAQVSTMEATEGSNG